MSSLLVVLRRNDLDDELVDEGLLVVGRLTGQADHDVPDDLELVAGHLGVLAEVVLGGALLLQAGSTVAVHVVAVAGHEGVAVALDREHLGVLVLAGATDGEAGLGATMEAVVHAVLLDAIHELALGVDEDVGVHTLDEHLGLGHDTVAVGGDLRLDVERLGVGDPPVVDVVAGGGEAGDQHDAVAQAVFERRAATLEIVGQGDPGRVALVVGLLVGVRRGAAAGHDGQADRCQGRADGAVDSESTHVDYPLFRWNSANCSWSRLYHKIKLFQYFYI